MDRILIRGNGPLYGDIPIGGSKNAALPLMAASLLSEEPLTLSNLPHLDDTTTMANLLIHLGAHITADGMDRLHGHVGRVLKLDARNVSNHTAPYDIVRKMRASVVVLGPLLARFGIAKV